MTYDTGEMNTNILFYTRTISELQVTLQRRLIIGTICCNKNNVKQILTSLEINTGPIGKC